MAPDVYYVIMMFMSVMMLLQITQNKFIMSGNIFFKGLISPIEA